MAKTKILITGASGKIGKILAPKLAESGFEVIGTYRQEFQKYPGIKWVEGDILNIDRDFKLAIEQADIVLHLAGKLNMFDNNCRKVNVEGTKNLLDCMNGKQKLIFFSSIEAFGPTDKNEAGERDIPHPLTVYGKSKLEAEKTIIDVSKLKGFEYIIFRIGNVDGLGEDSFKNVLKRLADSRWSWLLGENEINIVDIKVIFEVLAKSMESKEVWNKTWFLAGENVSMNSIGGKKEKKFLRPMKDLIIGIMKVLKKGGFVYYLGMGGSKRPYRRYSKEVYKVLGIK